MGDNIGKPNSFDPSRGQTRRPNAILQVSQRTWDDQYLRHRWRCLKDAAELARYCILAGLLQYSGAIRRIIDVGCGEGLLLEHLRFYHYEYYLGIDISSVALRMASTKYADQRTKFCVADAQQFCPTGGFDSIVFNECLYYLHDPLEIIQRYRMCLGADGVFVTSLFISSRAISQLAEALTQTYACIEQVTVHNTRGIWICALFANKRL